MGQQRESKERKVEAAPSSAEKQFVLWKEKKNIRMNASGEEEEKKRERGFY